MPIKLTSEALRAIFPRAPASVIDAFVSKQDVLTKAGINATRNRLAFFFANIEHECGGFTIPGLTENINYTAARMAQVWPNRFPDGASAVQRQFGRAAGWQNKAFDWIYGNRMGNRPGTSDGSTYIGRGGPQWTGRDGYAALERLTGIPVVATPSLASSLSMQPEICAAFWTWKGLNRFADANDFIGCVKAWNGGTNGLADRQHLMAGNDPVLKRLENVAAVTAEVPKEKVPANKAEQAAAGVGVAAVSAAAATGAQQGWGVTQWLVTVGLLIAIGAVVYLGLRWWRRRQEVGAVPVEPPMHEPLIPVTLTLPPAGAIWVEPKAEKAPTKRKSAAKKPAKRKPAKKKAA